MDTKNLNVLIVDDNETCRKIAESIIKKDFDCLSVENGEKAVELFKQSISGEIRRFDVVLLDFEMPEMDGFDVIRAIRKIEKSERIALADHIKIIMLTSHKDINIAKSCKDAGCNHYIVKPITVGKIKEKFEILHLPKIEKSPQAPNKEGSL